MCYRTACLESRNKTKPNRKDNTRMKVQSSWHPDSREQESHASARSLLKTQQGDSGMHQAVLFQDCLKGILHLLFPISVRAILSSLSFFLLLSSSSPINRLDFLHAVFVYQSFSFCSHTRLLTVSKGTCQSSKPMLNLYSLRLASQLQHFQSSSSGNPVIPWLRGFL